jgi:antitoxin ParD1/3/4
MCESSGNVERHNDPRHRSHPLADASEVLREGLRLVQQREAEDAAKLKVLRKAAGAGFGALDRGEFKAFDTIDDLQANLNAASDKIISGAGDARPDHTYGPEAETRPAFV